MAKNVFQCLTATVRSGRRSQKAVALPGTGSSPPYHACTNRCHHLRLPAPARRPPTDKTVNAATTLKPGMEGVCGRAWRDGRCDDQMERYSAYASALKVQRL